MSIDILPSSLDKVKRTGPGRWQSQCPAHDDRSPSLAIRELADGRILLHFFAGCDVHSVLDAIGLQMTDLYPERLGEHLPRERRPFHAADILRCLYADTLFLHVCAADMTAGEALAESDRIELVRVAGRLSLAAEAAGL